MNGKRRAKENRALCLPSPTLSAHTHRHTHKHTHRDTHTHTHTHTHTDSHSPSLVSSITVKRATAGVTNQSGRSIRQEMIEHEWPRGIVAIMRQSDTHTHTHAHTHTHTHTH